MSDKGIRLAALYSAGCPELTETECGAAIDSFLSSGNGSGPSTEEVKKILERLDPFAYYQLIATANGEEDVFSESVVRAHWLGAGDLSPVADLHVRRVLGNTSLEECLGIHRLVALVTRLRGLIGFLPHHNFCALHLFTALRKGIKIPDQLILSADQCLIRPAKVLAREGNFLQVKTLSLVSRKDGLDLNIRTTKVEKWLVADQDVFPNLVSIHLGRAREMITEVQYHKLEWLMEQAVNFSNK